MSENKNDISEVGQRLSVGKAYLTTWVIELEARIRHLEGKMERAADLLAVSGRAKDLPSHLSAVAELLRESYAICEPDRSPEPTIPPCPTCGTPSALYEAYHRIRGSLACPGGLLQHLIRELVEECNGAFPKDEGLRVHASLAELQNRANHLTSELLRRMDTVERRGKLICWCGSEHVSEHGPKRRAGDWNYLSGTKWKDKELLNLRPVLEPTTPNKISTTLDRRTYPSVLSNRHFSRPFGNRSGRERRVTIRFEKPWQLFNVRSGKDRRVAT